MENDSELISLDAGDIKRRIFTIRGRQVMLDSALCLLIFSLTSRNLTLNRILTTRQYVTFFP